jgi:hypothetical protein
MTNETKRSCYTCKHQTRQFTDVFDTLAEACDQYQRETEKLDTREVLAKFLPIAWETAGHDRNNMAALLADAPVLGEYFDIDSPEVKAVMEHEQK